MEILEFECSDLIFNNDVGEGFEFNYERWSFANLFILGIIGDLIGQLDWNIKVNLF